MPEVFEINQAGRSVETLLEDLKATPLTDSDKGILVASWIFQNFGNVQRSFNYTPPLAESDPACVAKFDAQFRHKDWTDGEDVVQAAGDNGFNIRFQRIEHDFGSLAADVAALFVCLKDLRSQLHARLEEIRAEINRINAAVFKLQGGSTPPTLGPISTRPPFANLIDASAFLGRTKFLDKDVNVWNTPQGMLMLPTVDPAGLDATNRGRLNAAPGLSRYLAEHDKALEGVPAITKEAVINKLGNEELTDGQKIRDVLEILPDGAKFNSADEMIDAIAERQAAAVRSSGASASVLSHVLEAPAGVSAPQANVDAVATIPPEMRAALVKGGVNSVSDLSGKSADEIKNIAVANNVEVTLGQAAEWRALARTVKLIH